MISSDIVLWIWYSKTMIRTAEFPNHPIFVIDFLCCVFVLRSWRFVWLDKTQSPNLSSSLNQYFDTWMGHFFHKNASPVNCPKYRYTTIIPGRLSTSLVLWEGNQSVTNRFPYKRPSDEKLWCFLCCFHKQSIWGDLRQHNAHVTSL